jgi:surface-anchored protein
VIDVAYAGGKFAIGVHDETVVPAVERHPDEVLFLVKPQARTSVPSDPAYGFLGAPGAPVWILPAVQNPDLLWPGLSTEALVAGVFQGDSITVEVQRVTGPGQLAIFTEDPLGRPDVLADSGDGRPDAIQRPVANHLHANWAFDLAGSYCVTVRAKATLAGTGQPVASDPVVLRFHVAS